MSMDVPGPQRTTPPQKVNVLVVDDTPDSLLALEAILGGLDRNIIKVSSGHEALKCLLDEQVGVILLDVKMAGMDGYETAALIRAREGTRDVPIIFLTAHNKDEADVTRGYTYGAADYLFKPVVPEVLKSKVDCFVELAKRAEALTRKNQELIEAQQALLRVQEELNAQAATLTDMHRTVGEHLALLDLATETIIIRDLNHKIVLWNRGAEQLFGWKKDEVLGQDMYDLLKPEFPEPLEAICERLLAQGHWTGEVREVTREGKAITVKSHWTLGDTNGIKGRYVEIAYDITQQKDTEQALRSTRDELERRVNERTSDLARANASLEENISELQKFEEAVVGRELKMIELEKELAQLRQRLQERSRIEEDARHY
jgi:two-component system, sporulation sensor kinase E